MWQPFDSLRRAWRTRGFGIHSPSAYSFVTEVIGCPHGYYAYEAIADAAACRADERLARLLYRAVIRLRPRSLVSTGTPTEAAACAIRLLKGAYFPGEGTMYIVWPDSAVLPRPEAGDALLLTCIDRPERTALLHDIRSLATIFSGRRTAIAMIRPSIPPQRHEVCI